MSVIYCIIVIISHARSVGSKGHRLEGNRCIKSGLLYILSCFVFPRFNNILTDQRLTYEISLAVSWLQWLFT